MDFLLCSECFSDIGLKYNASRIGVDQDEVCQNCKAKNGLKLDKEKLLLLTSRYFVKGSMMRCEYGGAPHIQFNEHHFGKNVVQFAKEVQKDAELISNTLKIGFFYYGPNMWMIGHITPLEKLQDKSTRHEIVKRIVTEYPDLNLTDRHNFFRLRTNPKNPSSVNEYDSAPEKTENFGRLDSTDLAALYGSPDIQICIHETRIGIQDECYAANMRPTRVLRCLNLAELIEDGSNEIESLDLAVHFLFLAGKHSYEISQDIARSARSAGFDGIIFPSYFSSVRTGSSPFESVYGLSRRRLPSLKNDARAQLIPNVALFGKPIAEGKIEVQGINRVFLKQIEHDVLFGPITWNG